MQETTFHNYKPETLSFYDAVVDGLSSERKFIPPKFFYDERGSKLFDRICEQPEYYVPTVERQLLVRIADEIASHTGKGRVLIEPGAGSAEKVRLILDALRPAAFVPMDISFDYLKSVAKGITKEYPWLPVHATCVDYTHSLPVPEAAPAGPRLVFFPGSSLGNFDPDEAATFLGLVRETVGDDGMLLIGVDTKKCKHRLNAAYNDAAGVTAKFNLNLLYRMRDELNVNLDLGAFEHQAFYNTDAGRIEMYLRSLESQKLHIDGHSFHLEKDELLHTENSYKYTPEQFLSLASRSAFTEVHHWQDKEGLFAIYLLQAS